MVITKSYNVSPTIWPRNSSLRNQSKKHIQMQKKHLLSKILLSEREQLKYYKIKEGLSAWCLICGVEMQNSLYCYFRSIFSDVWRGRWNSLRGRSRCQSSINSVISSLLILRYTVGLNKQMKKNHKSFSRKQRKCFHNVTCKQNVDRDNQEENFEKLDFIKI